MTDKGRKTARKKVWCQCVLQAAADLRCVHLDCPTEDTWGKCDPSERGVK